MRLTEQEREALASAISHHRSVQVVRIDGVERWVCDGCAQPIEQPDPYDILRDLLAHQANAAATAVEAILSVRLAEAWKEGAFYFGGDNAEQWYFNDGGIHHNPYEKNSGNEEYS